MVIKIYCKVSRPVTMSFIKFPRWYELGIAEVINSNSVTKTQYTPVSSSENSPTKPCSRDYRPVCRIDRVTYGNLCTIESKEVAFSHHGECTSQVKNSGNVLFTNVNVFDDTSETLAIFRN